jgi:hypothetical protein
METITIANVFIFLLVCGICVYFGLDLKKWSSWLFGLYGFRSGFLFGYTYGDMKGCLEVGALFAFMVMYGGTTSRSHWHRFGNDE